MSNGSGSTARMISMHAMQTLDELMAIGETIASLTTRMRTLEIQVMICIVTASASAVTLTLVDPASIWHDFLVVAITVSVACGLLVMGAMLHYRRRIDDEFARWLDTMDATDSDRRPTVATTQSDASGRSATP